MIEKYGYSYISMKKYLREIEISGIILLFIGTCVGHFVSVNAGAIVSLIGILLWVAVVIYKSLKWQEYRRDNIVNIFIMLGAILAILISFMTFAKNI